MAQFYNLIGTKAEDLVAVSNSVKEEIENNLKDSVNSSVLNNPDGVIMSSSDDVKKGEKVLSDLRRVGKNAFLNHTTDTWSGVHTFGLAKMKNDKIIPMMFVVCERDEEDWVREDLTKKGKRY